MLALAFDEPVHAHWRGRRLWTIEPDDQASEFGRAIYARLTVWVPSTLGAGLPMVEMRVRSGDQMSIEMAQGSTVRLVSRVGDGFAVPATIWHSGRKQHGNPRLVFDAPRELLIRRESLVGVPA